MLSPLGNLVGSQDALQTFTKIFPSLHSQGHIIGVPDLQSQVPDGTIDDLGLLGGSGPLEVTPSVISTNYLCSVPRRKPLGSLILAILLADIVLLQSVWGGYNVALGWLLRKHISDCCKGCQSMPESQPLNNVSRSRSSSMSQSPSLYRRTTSSSTEYAPLHLGRVSSVGDLVQREEHL